MSRFWEVSKRDLNWHFQSILDQSKALEPHSCFCCSERKSNEHFSLLKTKKILLNLYISFAEDFNYDYCPHKAVLEMEPVMYPEQAKDQVSFTNSVKVDLDKELSSRRKTFSSSRLYHSKLRTPSPFPQA